MSAYYVYTRRVDRELYWTGAMLEGGTPDVTDDQSKARPFETAREAYDEAGKLRRLAAFRVGRREPTYLREHATNATA